MNDIIFYVIQIIPNVLSYLTFRLCVYQTIYGDIHIVGTQLCQ